MPRRIRAKKTILRKAKTNIAGRKFHHKDMRFSVSLVVLIGMLAFSAMLLLFSLNKSSVVNAETNTIAAAPTRQLSEIKKPSSQTIDDSALDFKITVPPELGQWFYKTGEVKSLTDKSLSDQYFQIYVPVSGVKSNNFDEQNKNILTIRKFSAGEWSSIEKGCQQNKKDICDAAGEQIAKTTDANGDDWVYAAVKPADCPKSIEAKCALADKIIQSFQMK